jgi:hypothetical protein
MFFFGLMLGGFLTVVFEAVVMWLFWENRVQIKTWLKANL